MHYHYDKKGAYIGATNDGSKIKGSAGCTGAKPESGQLYDSATEKWIDREKSAARKVKSPPKGPDSYAIKVAGYNLNKVKGALRFVKNPEKRAVLEARLAELTA